MTLAHNSGRPEDSWRVRQLAVTASTNDDAKQAAASGEPEGCVIWALKQTAGRGRYGRGWESPQGNLYHHHDAGVDGGDEGIFRG